MVRSGLFDLLQLECMIGRWPKFGLKWRCALSLFSVSVSLCICTPGATWLKTREDEPITVLSAAPDFSSMNLQNKYRLYLYT